MVEKKMINSIHKYQLPSEMKCVWCFAEDTRDLPKVKPQKRKRNSATSPLNEENLQQEAGGNSEKS